MSRTRQFIVWVCMAASLWMGAGHPLHGLAHAVQAAHGHEAGHEHDESHNHRSPCEQCGLFAALDGATPSAPSASLPAVVRGGPPARCETPARALTFTAYVSRAPPATA